MDPRVRLLVAASCAVATCAWTARARAEDEAAFFTLIVNQVPQGNVFIVLRDGDVLMDRKDLEGAGLSHFTATEVKAEGHDLISLASVQPRIRFDTDEDNIVLKVDAPVEMLPSHQVDLSSQPQDISFHSRASAFLNYSPSVSVSTTGPASGSAFIEGGISETNRLWYSSFTGGTELGGVTRQLTNLTVDNRAGMVHTIVGDANVATGAIGAATVITGITYARDFSLNPYFIRFPSMRFASSTDVPANVDVYVNGIRTKSIALDPGTFTLDNLKGLAGGGTVQYVLRDALGGTQSFSSPYYVAASVLKKGLDDFAITAGAPRDNVGVVSNLGGDVGGDYELPAFLGFYRRGITDWLTLGVRGEGQWGTVLSGGPDIATTTPLGVFELELGASAGGSELAQSGAAGIFSYQYLNRRLSVSTSFRALSPQYSYVQLSPSQDRALYQVSSAVSVPFSGYASVTTLFSLGVNRDEPATANVGMFTTFSLTRSLTLGAQVSFGTSAPPVPQVNGLLNLSWTLPQATYVGAGASVQNNVGGANLQMSKSSSYGEGWGMSAAANITDSSIDLSLNHRLQTTTNVLQTFLDWQGTGGTLSVNPAGSIVWVTGHGFFLARPIVDAFALVRVPDVKDVRVYLNSQEIGRTNAKGEILVPSMISYYGSQLKIASQDVPLSYVLDQDMIIAAAPRRGAAFAEFRATHSHYFRGRVVVVRDGKESVPAYGDLAVKDHGRENISPLGEEGEFELEGLTSGPHPAEIRHTKGICRFEFDAKEVSDAPLIDLGLVKCTVGAAPASK